jgi:hypothetical protein
MKRHFVYFIIFQLQNIDYIIVYTLTGSQRICNVLNEILGGNIDVGIAKDSYMLGAFQLIWGISGVLLGAIRIFEPFVWNVIVYEIKKSRFSLLCCNMKSKD